MVGAGRLDAKTPCSEDLALGIVDDVDTMRGMFIRPCFRTKDGKRYAYWALVESFRTQRGPRQRVVAYLGQLDEAGRLWLDNAATGPSATRQPTFTDETEPEWVTVDAAGIRVENCRQFGGPWLALELIRRLGLHAFLTRMLPSGSEEVPWSLTP